MEKRAVVITKEELEKRAFLKDQEKRAQKKFTCATCNPEVSAPDVDWCDKCRGEK